MKMTLTQNQVYKWDLLNVPNGVEKGQSYIVTDEHKDAPRGFALRVNKDGKKVYILQARLRSTGKGMRCVVCSVRDMTIGEAREKARKILQNAEDAGLSPTEQKQELKKSEITLGGAFRTYVNILTTRPKPATANSLTAIEKAQARVKDWLDIPLKNLTSEQILDRFDEMVKVHATATEQTFRWCTTAVENAIKLDALDAQIQKRPPYIATNPFKVLSLYGKYRNKQQLEKVYEEKGVRNPLAFDDNSIGAFLDAILEHRTHNKRNEVGCDYLLVLLLVGVRKNELSDIKWWDEDTKNSSYVDLDKKIWFFHETKNGSNHTLPLTVRVEEILRRRYENRSLYKGLKKTQVFPAQSPLSKTHYYSNANELLKGVSKTMTEKLKKPVFVRHHDLRRTFGRVVDSLGFSHYLTQTLLNHANQASSTFKYTQPEWERLAKAIQKVENTIFETSPTVNKFWS